MPPHPTSWRSILILSSHLALARTPSRPKCERRNESCISTDCVLNIACYIAVGDDGSELWIRDCIVHWLRVAQNFH
jgi:hypothetical protein